MLEIHGLGRRFGNQVVLDGLDARVAPGERVALWGPNGSGKTTLLRCAAGTVAPTEGRVTIAGHEAGSYEARRLTGASLSQERSFYLRLSGRSNLLFFARVRGLANRESSRHVRALEEELQLSAILAERVDQCSTGMVQQLAFARALLGDPKVLLLDEPTRSLDGDAVSRLWIALDRRRAAAVLLATHIRADIERCDRQLELMRAAA